MLRKFINSFLLISVISISLLNGMSIYAENLGVEIDTVVVIEEDRDEECIDVDLFDINSVVVEETTLVDIDFYSNTIKGDINEDGIVNSCDALCVLKYVARLTELSSTQIEAADVNSDGNISAADALEVLYKVAKIDKNAISSLPAQSTYMECYDSSNGKEESYDIYVLNKEYNNVKAIKLAVWSSSNGQDDIKWYTMDKKSDTLWLKNIAISEHNGVGNYIAHAYVVFEDGTQKLICHNTFQISKPEFSTEISSYNSKNGTFVVNVKPLNVPSGVKEIKVPVWCKADQSDIKWYEAVKKSDGTYLVTVEASLHDFHIGNYQVHAYLTDNNGNRVGKVAGFINVTKPDIAVNYVKYRSLGNGKYEIRVFYPNDGNVTDVQFPTWSKENGQDDIKWYLGSRNSDGSWSAIVDAKNHYNGGTFSTHVYGVCNGRKILLSSISYKVSDNEVMSEAEKRIDVNVKKIYSQVGRDLNACYWWCVNNLSYETLPIPMTPPLGYSSAQWYAIYAYENGRGNCFCYAAAFYWLAKGLGYDVQYVEGQVGMAAGGYGPHGWVVVTIDGTSYICDTEAQDEIPGRNFYMQPMGNLQLRYKW